MALAEKINQKLGVSPLFVITGYEETIKLLSQNGFKYFVVNKEKSEVEEIIKLRSLPEKDILIIDKLNQDPVFINELKKHYTVVSFDDTGGGLKHADVVFNSVLDSNVERKNLYFGEKYFLIRDEIGKYNPQSKNISKTVNDIVINLGASDPFEINFMVANWLSDFEYSGNIHWVIGAAVGDKEKLIKKINSCKCNVLPIVDCKNIGELYFNSDLCISAAGFSLYEMACVGIPALSMCLYRHQVPTATKFEKQGCIFNLGHYEKIKKEKFETSFLKLINNESERSKMSLNGKKFVDGLGMERVVTQINQLFN